jgi:hypothetical protein
MIHDLVGQAYNHIAGIFQPAVAKVAEAPKEVQKEEAPKLDNKIAAVAVAQIQAPAHENQKDADKAKVVFAVAQDVAPKAEAAKAEGAKEAAPKVAPKVEVAKGEVVKVEAPKVDAEKAKAEVAKVENPKVNPKAEAAKKQEQKPVEKKKQIQVKQVKNQDKRFEIQYLVKKEKLK